jgi:DNA-binding response OmpR family regulator
VILDNIMPLKSGWEVTRILKTDPEYADFRDTPIVMFSAMDDVQDKIEGFELGVEDYITKPFNFSEVLARIRAILRSKELSLQVIQRERRIALIESLNKSLLYFTSHLRQPVLDIINASNQLEITDAEAVKDYVEQVRTETETTLAALDGLEDEIRELSTQGDKMKEKELSLEMLDEKYQKHFAQYSAKKLDEASQ